MGSLRGCPAQLYVTGPVQPNYFQWACRGWPAQLYVTGAVQPINMCHRFVTVYVHILCMCACIHKVKPFQIVQKKSIENAFKNQSNFLSKINRKWFLQEISSIDFSFENWKSIEDWFWKKINRKIDFFQSRSLWVMTTPIIYKYIYIQWIYGFLMGKWWENDMWWIIFLWPKIIGHTLESWDSDGKMMGTSGAYNGM